MTRTSTAVCAWERRDMKSTLACSRKTSNRRPTVLPSSPYQHVPVSLAPVRPPRHEQHPHFNGVLYSRQRLRASTFSSDQVVFDIVFSVCRRLASATASCAMHCSSVFHRIATLHGSVTDDDRRQRTKQYWPIRRASNKTILPDLAREADVNTRHCTVEAAQQIHMVCNVTLRRHLASLCVYLRRWRWGLMCHWSSRD